MRDRGIRCRSLVAALLLLGLVLGARVRYTDSDPRVTLLTAQAVVETGRPLLNSYLPPEVMSREIKAPWSVWTVNGAMRNFYPPGTSMLAIPVVAVARSIGFDMVKTEDDARFQVLLAGILVAAIFLVFERTASLVLPPGLAFGVGFLFVLGTSITSTIGTALWSHGPVVLLSAIVVWRLCAAESRGRQPNGVMLGLLLGVAFWCRPTAAVPAVLVFVLLLIRARREVLRFLLASGTVVGALVVASYLELGQPLPVYYYPSTWPANDQLWVGLLGVLISPGRGLLVFSPLLLIGLAGWGSRRLRRDPLFLFSTVWAGCHVVMVARNADWWGGWCYGPRLLSDSLPAWFLLVSYSMAWIRPRLTSPVRRRIIVAALGCAALFSAVVHSFQGLYNTSTYWWNGRPNVYQAPIEKLFDVRNSQFLATSRRNDEAAVRFSKTNE